MSIYSLNGVEAPNAYDIDLSSLTDVYDISGNRIGMDNGPEFLDTIIVSPLSGNVNVTGVKQGACTDGTYIYQASGDSTNHTYMRIIKYKISDGTYSYVQYDGTPNFGHANDITYNPNNGYLYVCTAESDGSVIILDSSDLSYVDTVYLVNKNGYAYGVWQLCFDRLTNHILTPNGRYLNVYDQSFNYLYSIPIPEETESTWQGCETDGTYYYRVTYNPNEIDVIRLEDGSRVKVLTNPMSGEPETLMYDWNGHFYMSKVGTGKIFYSAQLFKT